LLLLLYWYYHAFANYNADGYALYAVFLVFFKLCWFSFGFKLNYILSDWFNVGWFDPIHDDHCKLNYYCYIISIVIEFTTSSSFFVLDSSVLRWQRIASVCLLLTIFTYTQVYLCAHIFGYMHTQIHAYTYLCICQSDQIDINNTNNSIHNYTNNFHFHLQPQFHGLDNLFIYLFIHYFYLEQKVNDWLNGCVCVCVLFNWIQLLTIIFVLL